MQLLAGNTNQIRQCRFDVHVDIFQLDGPVELTAGNFCLYLFQTVNNGIAFFFSQYVDMSQHSGMGNGTGNILLIHALIKTDRSGKCFNKGIGWFSKAAIPGFLCLLYCLGGACRCFVHVVIRPSCLFIS